MRELTERARATSGTKSFNEALSADLRDAFDKYIVPIARDATDAHGRLRRCEFSTEGGQQDQGAGIVARPAEARRSATGGSTAARASVASTSEPARRSTIFRSRPTWCSSRCCGVCATS